MSQYDSRKVRPEILSVLDSLRSKIRRYVFLEGFTLVLCVIAILFWVGLSINWVYFKASNLELPFWFRALFNIGSLCLIALTFLVWVVTRTLRHFNTKSLALVLEQHFPGLDDRLITAVEVEQSTANHESDLTEEMRNLTVQEVAQATKKLNVSHVFSSRPLVRALIFACVLFVSIGGLWVVKAQAVENWYDAYILMKDRYWQRETSFDVTVLAYPGERIKEFHDGAYMHPKGGDFDLVVTVPEGNNTETGKPWVVPQHVRVIHGSIDEKGNFVKYMRDSVTCKKTGDREFRFSIAKLNNSMKFWVEGGDYISPKPYSVQIVTAPTIDKIELSPYYPEYTGLNTFEEDGMPVPVEVSGTDTALPFETQFVFQSNFNKSINNVRIEGENFTLSFGHFPSDNAEPGEDAPFSAKLIQTNKESASTKTTLIPQAVAQNFISSDGMTLQVPLFLSTSAENTTKDGAEIVLPEIDGKVPLPHAFAISPGKLTIHMEDRDGIASIVPVQVTINGIIDTPPEIEIELIGIDPIITRIASIPVKGLIKDEKYGVVKTYFEFRVNDGEKVSIRQFQNPPKKSTTEFRLNQLVAWKKGLIKDRKVERFNVTSLDLKIGQKLTLSVYAEDGDHLNGPHSTRTEQMVFTIVSKEDLLADLYQKEVILRTDFQRVITEVEEVRAGLADNLNQLAQVSDIRSLTEQTEKDREKLENLLQSIQDSGTMSFLKIGENHKNNKQIQQDFEEIIEKLVNNGVHTRLQVEDQRKKIIDPLNDINSKKFVVVNDNLSLFKLANKKGRNPKEHIENSIEEIDEMLIQMNKVLDEMKDLMDFHKSITVISDIIKKEEELRDKVKDKRDKELIEELKK